MEADGEPLLQVPRHELRVVDDGTKEVVEIMVQLPGVESAGDINVLIDPPHIVTVTVPSRYHLELRLATPIAKHADSVKFKKKTAKLTMNCRVLTEQEAAADKAAAAAAAAAAAGVNGSRKAGGTSNNNSSSGSGRTETAQVVRSGSLATSSSLNRGDSTAAAAAAGGGGGGSSDGARQQQQQQGGGGVHASFFPQPTKAELKKQQQEEERRQQEEEQRRREAEAAAAAEAERRQQQEAAAAARRAAEEKKREEAKRKAEAAAAVRATAAEQQQRREQQRRLNKAAAEEWLSRGQAAAAQGDIDLAAKALKKVQELDPANKEGIQKLTKDLSSARKKAAAAAAAGGSSAAGSGSAQHMPPPKPQQQSQQQQTTPPPAPGSSSSGGGAPQQQQRQQQQQRETWGERRRRVGHGVRDRDLREILDKWSAGGHASGPVGWWCAALDWLMYWVTWLGAVVIEWASGKYPAGVPLGNAWHYAVVGVGLLGNLVMFAPPLSMVLWQMAWQKPLSVVAAIRRMGGDSHLESVEWLLHRQATLSSDEDVLSALTKLLLVGSSGGTLYAAVWGTCLLPLGSHSMLGWLWALLSWLWRVLLWAPSYTLHVVGAAAGTFFCSSTRPGPCSLVILPLQVLMCAGGWTTLLSAAANIAYHNTFKDWRRSWSHYKAPHWQSAFVSVVPVLLLRFADRIRLGWLLRLPVTLLGGLCGSLLDILTRPAASVLRFTNETTVRGLAVLSSLWRPFSWVSTPATAIVECVNAAVMGCLGCVLPASSLQRLVEVVCASPMLSSSSLHGPMCVQHAAGKTAFVLSGAGSKAAGVVMPHAWWVDVLLFVWMFYVAAVLTQWEEDYGREYYRQRQQERQQQDQQRRRRQEPGSDDEAEHTPWGDKTSDFPMGFGAVPVPAGCEVATVRAVLEAADYYKVMGYTSRDEVTVESLKLKRRQLVLAVHPDKVGHDYPGANQAAGRVNKAFETLSDEGMRKAYDSILTAHSRGSSRGSSSRTAGGGGSGAAAGGAGGGEVQEFSHDLYDRPTPEEMAFLVQDMECTACGGHHTTYILPNAPFGVRWCADCGEWHPVKQGEIWPHWSPGPMGMSWLGSVRLLLCADPHGPVYDITEIFRCKEAGTSLPRVQDMCNRHVNPFASAARAFNRGGGGGGGTSTARRSRKKGRRR